MSMNTPIVDFVRRYAQSGTSRLHMPGHKGQDLLGFEPWDITEIQGADELYAPEGIIAQSEANATRLFGTAHTYYSTEGSSQCIRAMLFLAMQAAPQTGRRPVLLAARNAHKALLYTAALLDFDIRWLWPAPEDAGAEGSRHPITLGAAMCCDSGHKTLPVVTGGAYLHLGPDAPVQEDAAVRGALALFGSTSPSYLILQSLDKCNQILSEGYPLRLLQCGGWLTSLRRELNELAGTRHSPVPLALGGEQQEPLKLTLDAAALGISGTDLAEALRPHHIECEYADPRYVVLMFTPDNPPQDYQRLREAVEDVARSLPEMVPEPEDLSGAFTELARQMQAVPPRCTIRQAVFAPQERIPVQQALGRICAMPTVSCPPAIPIAVSGEAITPAALQLMQKYGVAEVSVLKNR